MYLLVGEHIGSMLRCGAPIVGIELEIKHVEEGYEEKEYVAKNYVCCKSLFGCITPQTCPTTHMYYSIMPMRPPHMVDPRGQMSTL